MTAFREDQRMERAVAAIERIGGLFLLAVATLTFAMVILRKFFDTSIPDWYDFSRLLQGIAIFWGIACACWRGGHIVVDLIWEWLDASGRRRMDLFANLLTVAFVAAFAVMALVTAWETIAKNLLTSDLRWPQWPWFMIGAVGIAAATLAAVARLLAVQRGDATEPVDG